MGSDGKSKTLFEQASYLTANLQACAYNHHYYFVLTAGYSTACKEDLKAQDLSKTTRLCITLSEKLPPIASCWGSQAIRGTKADSVSCKKIAQAAMGWEWSDVLKFPVLPGYAWCCTVSLLQRICSIPPSVAGTGLCREAIPGGCLSGAGKQKSNFWFSGSADGLQKFSRFPLGILTRVVFRNVSMLLNKILKKLLNQSSLCYSDCSIWKTQVVKRRWKKSQVRYSSGISVVSPIHFFLPNSITRPLWTTLCTVSSGLPELSGKQVPWIKTSQRL